MTFWFSFWLWVQKLQKVLSGVPEAVLVSYVLSLHPHRKRSSPVTVPFHEDESSLAFCIAMETQDYVQLIGSKLMLRPGTLRFDLHPMNQMKTMLLQEVTKKKKKGAFNWNKSSCQISSRCFRLEPR